MYVFLRNILGVAVVSMSHIACNRVFCALKLRKRKGSGFDERV